MTNNYSYSSSTCFKVYYTSSQKAWFNSGIICFVPLRIRNEQITFFLVLQRVTSTNRNMKLHWYRERHFTSHGSHFLLTTGWCCRIAMSHLTIKSRGIVQEFRSTTFTPPFPFLMIRYRDYYTTSKARRITCCRIDLRISIGEIRCLVAIHFFHSTQC